MTDGDFAPPEPPQQQPQQQNGAGARVIEVEKKIFLSSQQREALRASLPPGKSKEFWDVYYDGPGLELTKNDWWLRQRAGTWELKIPVSFGQGMNHCQSYEEVDDPCAILRRLVQSGLIPEPAPESAFDSPTKKPKHILEHGTAPPSVSNLVPALEAHGVFPFCKLHTARTSIEVRRDGETSTHLSVDLDTVTFDPIYAESWEVGGDGHAASGRPFVIAEVEMMVPAGHEAQAADTLDAFLDNKGLGNAPRAYSKVFEYLMRFRPRHLDSLVAAGGICRTTLDELKVAMAEASK